MKPEDETCDTASPTYHVDQLAPRLRLRIEPAPGIDLLLYYKYVEFRCDDTPENRGKFIRLFRNFADHLERLP